MRVRTQREVLEYFWKNPNDRSRVQRKICSGMLHRVDWGYEFMESKENEYLQEIYKMRDEIQRLEVEKAELEAECTRLSIQHPEEVRVTEVRNGIELDHVSYLYERLMMREQVINNFIQSFFDKNRQSYDWEWAKKEVYERFWFVEDLDEKDELNFISWMIKNGSDRT